MTTGTFRDAIKSISVGWLAAPVVGEKVGYAIGIVLDAVSDGLKAGVRVRFPGAGTDEALPAIGRDRQIERGPNEDATAYAARLRVHLDTWSRAGSAGAMLEQLRHYFTPSFIPIRVVSSKADWHEIDPGTGVVTKTANQANWTWDSHTDRWWRAWPILDSSGGPWTPDLWGDPGNWGDGGTWGSNATLTEVNQIRSIVAKWKPAHAAIPSIIMIFNATHFERTDAKPPNPDGAGDSALWRQGYNALFLTGVR